MESLEHDSLSILREFTSPQILLRHAEGLGRDKIAIREKAYGLWQPFNWKEYLEYAKEVCLGLLSLGLKRGEHVGLITDNRPEWLFSELGAQAAGAVTVNLFTSTTARELVYDLNHINASYVFVENRRQLEKLLEHRESFPQIRRVIFIDPLNMLIYKDEPWILSFSQLLDLGKNLGKKDPGLFTDELWKGKPDDTAMILMTSGTSGMPKPAMISYRNLMEMAVRWLENVPLGVGDNCVSISPCATILEETWCMGIALAGGITINFPETPESLMDDIREIGPSVILAYPGFWEHLMSLIRTDLEDSGSIRKWIYNRSYETCRIACDLESKSVPVPMRLKCLQKIFRSIMTRPLMDRTGLLGVRHAYTGGHPISPEVIKFFRCNGLALKQCYGLAETAGMFQFQGDDDESLDTVGKPLPGIEIAISTDKEIFVSGKFNFSGYYHDPESTSNILKEGLLYTGDAGYLDNKGRLVIVGRKEDIVTTEAGQTFSRDFIETRIKESVYIKEAVIWGKGKPYLIAFIGIDFENTLRWAERHNLLCHDYSELTRHPDIEELIKDEIYNLNRRLPDYMHIRRIILINKQLDTDEELTKTGIARRKFLFEQYRDIIDAMYADKQEAQLVRRLRDDHDDMRTFMIRTRIVSIPEGGR